jgi:hypothetical protein
MQRQNSPMVTAELCLVQHQRPPPITLPRLSSNEGFENEQYLPKYSANQGDEDHFELSRKSEDLQEVAINLGWGVDESQAVTPEVAPTAPRTRTPGDEKPKDAPQPVSPTPGYQGDDKDGKKQGFVKRIWPDGTCIWPDGTCYVGDWKDGKQHGRGKKTWPDGTCYEGNWEGDKQHGIGTKTWPDGERYEGEWKDGKPAITICAYLTDVEGNLDYFYNYVEISRVLEWENKETKNRLKFKHEHTMFVFGGDSQDKGIGDIRFTKLLLDLKAQKGNEDRVEFIIGNRDANKLRLASELQDDCIDDPAVLDGMRE